MIEARTEKIRWYVIVLKEQDTSRFVSFREAVLVRKNLVGEKRASEARASKFRRILEFKAGGATTCVLRLWGKANI